MSPNATDSSTILRDDRKIPNGCANGWSGVSDSSEKQCWKSQAALKVNEIVGLVKHYALRAYIVCWREYTGQMTNIWNKISVMYYCSPLPQIYLKNQLRNTNTRKSFKRFKIELWTQNIESWYWVLACAIRFSIPQIVTLGTEYPNWTLVIVRY